MAKAYITTPQHSAREGCNMNAEEVAAILRAHDQMQDLTRRVVFAATDAEYHCLVKQARSRLKLLGADFEQRFRQATTYLAHRHI